MTGTPTAAAPLPDVQRARDVLIDALAVAAMPDVAHLEALAELDVECRSRGGRTEPDALSRLLFLTRRMQAERERRIATVRREIVPRCAVPSVAGN
jgi:hypothetical protein